MANKKMVHVKLSREVQEIVRDSAYYERRTMANYLNKLISERMK